jgi:hypothetical protein
MESYEGYIIFAAMIALGVFIVILGFAASAWTRDPRFTVAQRFAKDWGMLVGLAVAILTTIIAAIVKWLLKP